MSEKLNLLCMSFWLPPLIRPQSILIGKMLPEWINQNLKPVVMGYTSTLDWEIDLPVCRIPQQLSVRIIPRVPVLSQFVDGRYLNKLYKVASVLIREHKINIVFSFSNPQKSNILGAMLRQRLGVKFVSHFSDPYFDNPFKNFKGAIARITLERERFIIEQSDRIIFVNEALADLVMKKYSSSFQKKVVIIPHGYDKKDYPLSVGGNEKCVFSHIGAFYEQRTPESFFAALRDTIKKYPDIKKKILVRLVGAVNDYAGYSKIKLNSLIVEYGLQKIVLVEEAVSYKLSLKLMKQSDCLLIVDAEIKNSPFLPSKLIDYIGSETEIMAITTENSPTDIVVNKIGMSTFRHNEIEKISEFIVNKVKNGEHLISDKKFSRQFSVQETTKQLIRVFRFVLSE